MSLASFGIWDSLPLLVTMFKPAIGLIVKASLTPKRRAPAAAAGLLLNRQKTIRNILFREGSRRSRINMSRPPSISQTSNENADFEQPSAEKSQIKAGPLMSSNFNTSKPPRGIGRQHITGTHFQALNIAKRSPVESAVYINQAEISPTNESTELLQFARD